MKSGNDEKERKAITGFLTEKTEERFCVLFDAFYGRLRRYFVGRGLDLSIAEELAENVMFLVYRRISQLRDGPSFHGWMFQIARNELLQHQRKTSLTLSMVEYEPIAAHLSNRRYAGSRREGPFLEWMSHMD